MPDIDEQIAAATEEAAALNQKIAVAAKAKRDKTLAAVAKGTNPPPIRGFPGQIKCRRALKGHFGKVTAMHWGGDSRLLVSASQDGNFLVWNAATNHKLQVITLKSSYVMAAGIEQTNGNLVACGGLDNLCNVYRRDKPGTPIELAVHDGFISCCRFLSEQEILSSSGDSTIIRWDIERLMPKDTFAEHTADAMYICLKPGDKNVFASCSVDKSCKIWDIRSPKKSAHTISGFHSGDINSIDFMPCDSNVFATASQDNSVRLFDIRTCNEIGAYGQVVGGGGVGADGIPVDGFTSVACSKSGRLVFAGHMSGTIHAYDVLSEKETPVFSMTGVHERAVSDIGVSPHGDALCTAGWDGILKVWA